MHRSNTRYRARASYRKCHHYISLDDRAAAASGDDIMYAEIAAEKALRRISEATKMEMKSPGFVGVRNEWGQVI